MASNGTSSSGITQTTALISLTLADLTLRTAEPQHTQFDHRFVGLHGQSDEIVAVRNNRPAFLNYLDDEKSQDDVARYMPHISQDGWTHSTTILGMACGTYLCGLSNLDGQLRRNEYLEGQILLSGVRLAVGHHDPPIVFVPREPLRGACNRDNIYVSEADKKVWIASRFAVLPINFLPPHWTVFVLDKSEKTVFSFNSMKMGRKGRAQTGFKLVKWMVECVGQSELALNLNLYVVPVPQQYGAVCGLIVLESVRLFFQCHYENQPHIVNGQTFHPDEAHAWIESRMRNTMGTSEVEETMQTMWLSALQRELGSPPAFDIRFPPTPSMDLGPFESIVTSEIEPGPNATFCTSTASTPIVTAPIPSVPIPSARIPLSTSLAPDNTSHQPSTGLSSLEETLLDFSAIYDKADTLAWSVGQRLEFLKDPESESLNRDFLAQNRELLETLAAVRDKSSLMEFLRLLWNTADRWLENIRTLYQENYRHDKWWRIHETALSSFPRDGILVSQKVTQKFRNYTEQWTAEFVREGGNPDHLVVPDLTKDDLIELIKLCPSLVGDNQEEKDCNNATCGNTPVVRLSANWLMQNIGTRFIQQRLRGFAASLWKEDRPVRLRECSLAARISQSDPGPVCNDRVWNRLRPEKSTDLPTSMPYFAAIPDMMRASHHSTFRDWDLSDDVWKLLSIISPKFLEPLLLYKDQVQDTDWLHNTLVFGRSTVDTGTLKKLWTSISNAEKLQPNARFRRSTAHKRDYAVDTISSVSDGSYSESENSWSEDHEPELKPNKWDFRNKSKLNKLFRRKSRNNECEQFVKEVLQDHENLRKPLFEAYNENDPWAQAQALGVMAIINRMDNVRMWIDSQAGSNVIAVEDLISALPGHQTTVTLMYKAISQILLLQDNPNIVSPRALALYLANPNDIKNLQAIANSFRPANNGPVPGLVYVLANTKLCEVVAICSTTSVYCSTFLFGSEVAVTRFKQILSNLFASFVKRLPLEKRWWSKDEGWTWEDRFTEVEPR